MGFTQPSKATVIFWTADLRVTASTRIVLVMIQGPSLVVASPDPSDSRPAGRGAYAIRACLICALEYYLGVWGTLIPRLWSDLKAPARPGLSLRHSRLEIRRPPTEAG